MTATSSVMSLCARLTSVLLSYLLVASLAAPLVQPTDAASPAAAPATRPAQAVQAASREGELIVRFSDGVTEADKDSVAAGKGARRGRKLRGQSRLETLTLARGQDPLEAAALLRMAPGVELAEPNFLITRSQAAANDTHIGEQWALDNQGQTGGTTGADLAARPAWEVTTGSLATVVAVVDSGIDFTHPDLRNNRWVNAQERQNGRDDDRDGYADDLHGWDWVAREGAIRDEHGHGTAIAGLIAAQGNNGEGVAGVMWRASLMSLRVLDNTGTGDVAAAVEAIDYALAHGAQVINLSWGTDGESAALREAIIRAGQSGVVVVASAGNGARDLDFAPHYPASFKLPNLISVASTDQFDQLAQFSDWGAASVAVAAPGVEVLTTWMGGSYRAVSGTSASAPLVAGIAGLVKTQRPWLNAEGTKKAVLDGARRIEWLGGKIQSGGVASASGALAASARLGHAYTMQPGAGNRGGHGNGNGAGDEGGGNGDQPRQTPRPGKPGHGGKSENEFKRAAPEKTKGAMPNLPNLDEIANKPSYVPQTAPEQIRANLAPICDNCYEAGNTNPEDPRFSTTRTQPENDTGEPGVDLGSRNYNWSAGLVSLPGRAGHDLNLSLYYNSLVWTKQDGAIQFNTDNGFPGPGFNLSFPAIQKQFVDHETGISAYLLITPTGGRTKLLRIGASNLYESNDGSYTQFDAGTNVLRTTDGTQFLFIDIDSGEKRCTQIKDRNGNFISISYHATGRINQLTDTLGRVLTFNYDGDGNLANISQPRAGMTGTLATFNYGSLYMQPNFPGLTVFGPINQHISVLTSITFADGSYYTFEYSPFGQVHTIRHYAPNGSQLAYTGYNLPGSHWVGMSGQPDCPRFTERRVWVRYGVMNNDAETVTTYSAAPDNSWSQVMSPDRMVYKEYFHTSGWQKGLPYQTEIFHADAPGIIRKKTTTTWAQDVTAPVTLSIGDAGFENPYVGYGAYQNVPNGGAWTFTSDAYSASGISGNNSALTSGMSGAPDGSQVAYLYGRSGATISQNVQGFAGGVPYTLSFYAAQRRYSNTGGQDFDVYLDDTLLGTYRPYSYSYTNFSVSFTTTPGAHTIKFVGRGSSGANLTALIDAVRITATGDTQANPRVVETNVYDEANNRRRTTIEYHPNYAVFGLPWQIVEYAADGATPLRRTYMDYKMDAVYLGRRLIGLPFRRAIYDGSWNLSSKIEYHYDWGGSDMFVDTPAAATQHDRTNFGPDFREGRGNLSNVVRFSAQDEHNAQGTAQETKFRYSTTGSVLMERDHGWHAIYYDYADSYSDGVNRNTFAFPTKETDGDNYSSFRQYNYDTGAVTRSQDKKGAVEAVQYDAAGRVMRVSTVLNNAEYSYRRFIYPADMGYVQQFSTITAGAGEARTEQHFDGAGRLRASSMTYPGSAGGYRAVHHMYDTMGRRVQTSNPTEINGGWVPSGDDAGGWVWTTQAYDWQGRPTLTTKPDGWTRETSYGGCGCAGGEQVTIRDERGRRRKLYKDVFGRLVRTEELNYDQSVYSTAAYAYNTADQLTHIRHYQGTEASGVYQERAFAYDGHGRLASRTTPEQGTTSFIYNADDTVNKVTDARGATTTYGYNNRHLVTSVSYGAPSGVAATANVSFNYDEAGNRTQMNDGMGSVSYVYDTLSRMTSETRTFSALGASYTLNYSYNIGGQLSGFTNHWNAHVGYNYDAAGQLTGVTGANYANVSSYASGLQYRAHGGIKSMSYGNGRQLSASYDGLLRLKQWNVVNVQGYEYGYDDFNEHTGRATWARNLYDSTLDRSFDYDHVGRLQSAHTGINARAHVGAPGGRWDVSDGPYAHDYRYDVWGNITQRLGWGGEAASSSSSPTAFNSKNQRAGFTYDAAGNITNDLGQNFVYDATGQQTSASYPGYSLTQYYDGDRLRVRKDEGYDIIFYLRSSVLGGRVVAELRWSGNWYWSRGYVYMGAQLLAVQQNGAVQYMHEDPVTKSKRVTDASGAVVSAVEVDPWGGDTNRSSNAAFQPRRFTSYDRDGNSSDEAMFRRYNRWHGRFDQPDPYDGSYDMEAPQSFNRYAYVSNDPVNFTDPMGLIALNEDYWRGLQAMRDLLDFILRSLEFHNERYPMPYGGDQGPGGPVVDPSDLGPPPPPPTQQKPIWCQQDVIDAMKRAWARTANGTKGNEAGFVLNGSPSNYSIVDTKSGNTQNEQKMTITRAVPGGPPATFLLFHVHPNSSTRNPSTPDNNAKGSSKHGDTLIADTYQARGQTILFLVGHRNGLTMYDPSKPPGQRLTNLRENLDWTNPCK
jgi:RHS repeat-associated protein